eukprot:432759-Rhodomonas_salina.1
MRYPPGARTVDTAAKSNTRNHNRHELAADGNQTLETTFLGPSDSLSWGAPLTLAPLRRLRPLSLFPPVRGMSRDLQLEPPSLSLAGVARARGRVPEPGRALARIPRRPPPRPRPGP